MISKKKIQLKVRKSKMPVAVFQSFNFQKFHISGFLLFFLLQIFFFFPAKAQNFASSQVTNRNTYYTASVDSSAKDTSKTRKKVNWNSPGMVALQSALLPGLGQISNGKLHIIKVPVIYAGFAVCAYFINFNNKKYIAYRDAYRLRTDGDTTTLDIFDVRNPDSKIGEQFSELSVLRLREDYRHDRDLTIIITAGVYFANILDAYVFAHLKDFDVSDDLSLHVKPVTFSNIAGRNLITTGVQLKFK